jgi:hypothetical protein
MNILLISSPALKSHPAIIREMRAFTDLPSVLRDMPFAKTRQVGGLAFFVRAFFRRREARARVLRLALSHISPLAGLSLALRCMGYFGRRAAAALTRPAAKGFLSL